MSSIKKQIESVQKLHGGEREQAAKYRSFIAWQLAQRRAASGDDQVSIIKSDNE